MATIINKTLLLVFVLIFWILIYAMFLLIGENLVVPAKFTNYGQTSQDVNGITLLLQVMFFSVPATYNFPIIISLVLDIIAILSLYVVIGIIFGKIIDAP